MPNPLPESLKGLERFRPMRLCTMNDVGVGADMERDSEGSYVRLSDVAALLAEQEKGAWSDWFVWVCPKCAEQFEYGPDGEPVEPCSHLNDCTEAERVRVKPLNAAPETAQEQYNKLETIDLPPETPDTSQVSDEAVGALEEAAAHFDERAEGCKEVGSPPEPFIYAATYLRGLAGQQ